MRKVRFTGSGKAARLYFEKYSTLQTTRTDRAHDRATVLYFTLQITLVLLRPLYGFRLYLEFTFSAHTNPNISLKHLHLADTYDS